MAPKLHFTLSRELVTEAEKAILVDDLAHWGLDNRVWSIWNMLLQTGSKMVRPMMVRGYAGSGRLAGVALIEHCSHTGKSLFANPVLAFLIDHPSFPIFYWERTGLLTDGHANPGFVAAGQDRHDFFLQAVAFLQKKYIQGCVVDFADADGGKNYVATPFTNAGWIDLRGLNKADDLYASSKNFRRKIRKFANKGGTIETIRGPLPPEMQAAALACMHSNPLSLLAAFQDNYDNMIRASLTAPNPNIVHFVARLEGEIVGYHTFAIVGQRLACLSGAFDRTRHTNFHAYENVLLTCLEFALAERLSGVETGPIVNPTKDKMVPGQRATEIRFYSRWTPMRRLLPIMLRYSRLRPQAIASLVIQDTTEQRQEGGNPQNLVLTQPLHDSRHSFTG